MQQLQKYQFDPHKPLSQPYDKEGIFNAYYHGLCTTTNKQVLISEFHQPKFDRLITKQKRLLKLKQIRHANIISIEEVILDREDKRLFVVLEWCQGGSIYEYEKENSTVDCDLAVRVLYDLMHGLRELHKAGQMHRHINMENVEFDGRGVPKLSFRCLYPKTYYLSPEDKQGNRGKQSDIFSLGVLVYKFLIGQTPFKGNSLEQQIKSVQEGAKFPKDERQIFPVALPIEVKNILIGMTMFKPTERLTNEAVIEQCQKFLEKMKCPLEPLNLPSSLTKQVSRGEYIPVHTRLASPDEHVFVCLCPSKHQLTKFHVIKAKSKTLITNYVQEVLEPFKQTKNQMEIVPVHENFVVEDEYLVIRTMYDNQGSLKYYLDHGGTMTEENINSFMQGLMNKLRKYGRSHSFLTPENIIIRRGSYYINYPPMMTKAYLRSLKNENENNMLLAPEVKNGKACEKSDAWSVAMLKFMLENKQMPSFDQNGKVIVPNKTKKTLDQLNFYERALVQDPDKRKGLFEPESKKAQSQILQIKVKQSPKRQSKIFVAKQEVPSQARRTVGQLLAQKLYMFYNLEKHWTKPLRASIKIVVGLLMLIFLFYLNLFLIDGQLITEHSLYEQKVVYIRAFGTDSTPEIEYNLVTKTPTQTAKLFYNRTLEVLRDDYKCVLNDYSVESNVVQVINQPGFIVYQVFGILLSLINLIVYCVSLSKMDFPKVFFISRLDQNNFNQLWNWMFINMALATQVSFVYLLYGSLFHLGLEPCLSKATLTAVEFLFKKWFFSFNIRFVWIYIGLVFSYFVTIFFVLKPEFVLKRILRIILVCLYLAGAFCRIMGQSGAHVAGTKESVFGKCGELLILLIGVIYFVLDTLFGCAIKSQISSEKTGNRVNDNSVTEMNQTQENFLPQ